MRNKTNLLIASSLIGLSIAFPIMAEEKQADAADEIVAIVNGTDLKRSTLDSVIEMAKRARPTQLDEKVLLDDLIATEIARQEAKKSGLGEREDVKAKVQNFADKLILNTWMQEKASSLKISDEELKAVYDERIKDMPKTEYKARHILVKTEGEGKALVKELTGGKDFVELAKEKSTGPSGPKGGDLGWFKPQGMVKPFAEAVAAMKVGAVSEAPVETQFGWHVIKLEEQRDVKLPEIDSMKPQLKRQLEQKKMLEHMKALRAKADIKVLLKEKEAEEPKPEDEEKEEKKSDS
uniref:peptidylprolyl isomerase n=1 Tax=uncultured Thiotrichaceae bacterium TaxID=298394 RepID=A0A6S6UEF6_9GAMM|nr:MAG: Foldase protein PrsA precursor (EC [uncultured Thiotrichaceae bacterium]